MKPRPDLRAPEAPDGVEIFQITDEDVPSSHIYMEAQIFTPDSTRFLLHRSATPHGGAKDDPEHRYLLCDLEDDCSLTPVTEKTGATAPSMTPDGTHFYYFVDETEVNGGRLTLERAAVDGSESETVMVIDTPPPGARFRPSRIYPLSTISSDGERLALSCFLGDGRREPPLWGLLRFDLADAEVEVILEGPSWCNIHPQYCRSTDAKASHDILVQENHGNTRGNDGSGQSLVSGAGADIHVLRDDATNFRDMPWGRNMNEFCQGHQCWRGRTTRGITSTGTREPPEQQLIEGRAAPHAGHIGADTPGGERNDLSRDFDGPAFMHFGTDEEGTVLVTDYRDPEGRLRVCTAEFGAAGRDPLRNWTMLADSGCSGAKGAHLHPFCSPDGSTAFFNSDESGVLQAYMIRGLDAARST